MINKVRVFFLAEPELRDLVLLNIRDWYGLGLRLHLPDSELRNIQHNNPGNEHACKREMFSLWVNMASPRATYEQLMEELHCLGENAAIKHIHKQVYYNSVLKV